jgi:hypothetical protein
MENDRPRKIGSPTDCVANTCKNTSLIKLGIANITILGLLAACNYKEIKKIGFKAFFKDIWQHKSKHKGLWTTLIALAMVDSGYVWLRNKQLNTTPKPKYDVVSDMQKHFCGDMPSMAISEAEIADFIAANEGSTAVSAREKIEHENELNMNLYKRKIELLNDFLKSNTNPKIIDFEKHCEADNAFQTARTAYHHANL